MAEFRRISRIWQNVSKIIIFFEKFEFLCSIYLTQNFTKTTILRQSF